MMFDDQARQPVKVLVDLFLHQEKHTQRQCLLSTMSPLPTIHLVCQKTMIINIISFFTVLMSVLRVCRNKLGFSPTSPVMLTLSPHLIALLCLSP